MNVRRKSLGSWVTLRPTELPTILALLHGTENLWNWYVALSLQLMLKEKTSQDLSKKAIIYDRITEELLIQRVIGWSLCQYSKMNPQWAEELMNELVLSPLAQRENSKYLAKISE